jgi:PAS domain S-box-containing protein
VAAPIGVGAVTDRRAVPAGHADQALRTAEARYRDLFESSPAGIAQVTLDGVPVSVNRAWASLMGYDSPEQFLTEVASVRELYEDPADRETMARIVREQGQANGFEVRLRRRDGASVWVALDAGAITSTAGEVTGLQGIGVDITERKRAEQALRESEERFRLLAENATDVITSVSTDSIIRYVSPASRELYGFEPEEMVGHSAWDYIHPEDHSMVRQTSVAVRVPGGHDSHAVEYHARRSDGSYVWVESKVRTLWDPVTGEAAGFRNATRDISERKVTEQALRESEERFRLLARNLTDRTVALEAVNQELESFSYSVSHDLRAPLRAIDGFTAMLEGDYADKLDDTGQNMLARVRRATAKMAALIDALLALSRLSRGQLTRSRLDISALAREIGQELRESDPDRAVEFVIEDGLYAVADGGLTRTALTNLLGNAWKFSAQRDDGRIEVASAGGRSFVVADNGVGFDMTYVDKLFVPFERLHRDDEVAGTGIGLATLNRIVNRHGGQLRGEGTVGQGAAFYFDFGDEALLG